MTLEEMKELFDSQYEEFLNFDRIVEPFTDRPDLHAFVLMDRLVKGDTDIVSNAQHDEIWLTTDPTHLATAATREQIIDLIRCGIRYDEDVHSFVMFI